MWSSTPAWPSRARVIACRPPGGERGARRAFGGARRPCPPRDVRRPHPATRRQPRRPGGRGPPAAGAVLVGGGPRREVCPVGTIGPRGRRCRGRRNRRRVGRPRRAVGGPRSPPGIDARRAPTACWTRRSRSSADAARRARREGIEPLRWPGCRGAPGSELCRAASGSHASTSAPGTRPTAPWPRRWTHRWSQRTVARDRP